MGLSSLVLRVVSGGLAHRVFTVARFSRWPGEDFTAAKEFDEC